MTSCRCPPPHFDVNIPLKSLTPPGGNRRDQHQQRGGPAHRLLHNYIRTTTASSEHGPIARQRERSNWQAKSSHRPNTWQTTRTPNHLTMTFPSDCSSFRTESPAIGSTYTVEIDGVIESYGEVPLGETVFIEVTITDDRSGTYFGSFDPGGGLWTMRIEEDRSIALEGYDPETDTVFSFKGVVDEDGNLSVDLSDLAAGAQLTGTVTDGEITGSVSILGYDVEGFRSHGEATAESDTLTYHGAVIGSKGTTVSATLGPDGTVLAVVNGELASTAAAAKIDGQGIFSGFLSDGSELELDLSDPDGAMIGVLSLVDSESWEVLGAAEGTPSSRLVNVSGRGPGSGRYRQPDRRLCNSEVRWRTLILIRAGRSRLGDLRIDRRSRSAPHPPGRSDPDRSMTISWPRTRAGLMPATAMNCGRSLLDSAPSSWRMPRPMPTVYLPVQPGPYTAVVQSVDGQAGIVLVEAYDADLGVFGTTSEGVANLSLTRKCGIRQRE